MLSYLLMKIDCCNLFLEIYFLKSIFRIVPHLELIIAEHWENVVKYRYLNKDKELNECQEADPIFEFNIFRRLNSKLVRLICRYQI